MPDSEVKVTHPFADLPVVRIVVDESVLQGAAPSPPGASRQSLVMLQLLQRVASLEDQLLASRAGPGAQTPAPTAQGSEPPNQAGATTAELDRLEKNIRGIRAEAIEAAEVIRSTWLASHGEEADLETIASGATFGQVTDDPQVFEQRMAHYILEILSYAQ